MYKYTQIDKLQNMFSINQNYFIVRRQERAESKFKKKI